MTNTIIIPKCASCAILESIDKHSLLNGFVGNVSDLYCNYLNNFGNVNPDVAEYIDDNKAFLDCGDIECILDNPDYIIQMASSEFYSTLKQLWKQWGSCNSGEAAEYTMRHANMYFDAWGMYYLFVNTDVASQYLIRADSEQDAIEMLITEFENAFSVDEQTVFSLYNDNGVPCNIDNLVLIGVIDSNN